MNDAASFRYIGVIIIPSLRTTKLLGGILVSLRPSVRPSEELSPLQYHFKSLHIISRHYKKSLLRSQIYHGYEELSTDTNYPIWRRQKLPYMKKTRKKKQVCGAACFMAAEIKFSEDVRPASRVRSVAPTVLVGFIWYLYILSSHFRRCVACKVSCVILKLEFLAIF